ncbi:MAG: hypothetical protein AB7T49_01280 [Oligoflexales bacterium]
MKKWHVNVCIALALAGGIVTFAACKKRGQSKASNTISAEDQTFAQDGAWKCGLVNALQNSLESWANTTQCKPGTLASIFSNQKDFTVIVCCSK